MNSIPQKEDQISMPAVHLQENSKLISGHVAEKKGYLYWVLNLTDENGKRKPKWIPTHKKVKGNKTWANNMLPTIRKEWTEKLLQEATASQQSASGGYGLTAVGFSVWPVIRRDFLCGFPVSVA